MSEKDKETSAQDGYAASSGYGQSTFGYGGDACTAPPEKPENKPVGPETEKTPVKTDEKAEQIAPDSDPPALRAETSDPPAQTSSAPGQTAAESETPADAEGEEAPAERPLAEPEPPSAAAEAVASRPDGDGDGDGDSDGDSDGGNVGNKENEPPPADTSARPQSGYIYDGATYRRVGGDNSGGGYGDRNGTEPPRSYGPTPAGGSGGWSSYAPPPRRRDVVGGTSLAAGILAILTSVYGWSGIVFGLTAFVLALLAARLRGRSMSGVATGGIACGAIGFFFGLFWLAVFLFMEGSGVFDEYFGEFTRDVATEAETSFLCLPRL